MEELNYYTDDELRDELQRRNLSTMSTRLDLVDQKSLNDIVAAFCNANWTDRARIVTAVKELGL